MTMEALLLFARAWFSDRSRPSGGGRGSDASLYMNGKRVTVTSGRENIRRMVDSRQKMITKPVGRTYEGRIPGQTVKNPTGIRKFIVK